MLTHLGMYFVIVVHKGRDADADVEAVICGGSDAIIRMTDRMGVTMRLR